MVADVSVVIPAYRADETLQRCVDSVLDQDLDSPFEVVVVASADAMGDLPALRADPRLRVVTAVPRLGAACARNRGVGEATGSAIAFTDADVIVSRGWLRELTSVSDGRLCVAGAVLNGTPRSLPGTVEYLVAFLDYHPRRPPETLGHGATCNLLVPRGLWDRLGPFPDDLEGGEDTILTTAAHHDGLFRFAPEARVTHLNRTQVRRVVRHHYEKGRRAAHVARRTDYRLRPVVRTTALAPLAAAARLVSLVIRLRWAPELAPVALMAAPLVVAAITAWGVGLAVEGRRIDTGRVRAP